VCVCPALFKALNHSFVSATTSPHPFLSYRAFKIFMPRPFLLSRPKIVAIVSARPGRCTSTAWCLRYVTLPCVYVCVCVCVCKQSAVVLTTTCTCLAEAQAGVCIGVCVCVLYTAAVASKQFGTPAACTARLSGSCVISVPKLIVLARNAS